MTTKVTADVAQAPELTGFTYNLYNYYAFKPFDKKVHYLPIVQNVLFYAKLICFLTLLINLMYYYIHLL